MISRDCQSCVRWIGGIAFAIGSLGIVALAVIKAA